MPTEMSMASTGLFDSNVLLRIYSHGDFPAGSQGTNASGLAAVAFSALPTGSTPAVPWCSAHDRQSCCVTFPPHLPRIPLWHQRNDHIPLPFVCWQHTSSNELSGSFGSRPGNTAPLAYARGSKTGFGVTQPCSKNPPLDEGRTTGSNFAMEPAPCTLSE
jgi:hypothetical protein